MSVAGSDSLSLRVPRYDLIRPLGQGGMGEVFLGRDFLWRRDVAIKCLRNGHDRLDRLRFEREIRTLSKLNHEGIVRLYDIGRHLGSRVGPPGGPGGELFFTMERVQGLPWSALLERPLPAREEIFWVVRALALILDALDYLHRARFVHRDIKPSNIMLLPSDPAIPFDSLQEAAAPLAVEDLLDEPAPQVKLMDFGLAISLEGAEDGLEEPGTPLYMAPERANRKDVLNPRSDLYSLGVLMYQTLTRRLPFEKLSDALSRRREPLAVSAVNPACPRALSEVVMRQLSAEPHRRSRSAADLRRALLEASDPRPQTAIRIHSPIFSGRAEELAQLESALRETSRGRRGKLILLSGATGMGKSWLLDRSGFKTRAVLDYGFSYSAGVYEESGPIHQGLRLVLAIRILELESEIGLDALARLLEPGGTALLEVFGLDVDSFGLTMERLREALPVKADKILAPLDSKLQREWAIQAAIAVLTFGVPTRRDRGADLPSRLIILGDLHRAEELDLEILRRLLPRLKDHALLIVATHDTSNGTNRRKKFAEWVRDIEEQQDDPVVEMVQLGPLSDQCVEMVVRSMLDGAGTPDRSLVKHVISKSKGHSATVESTLRDLWSDGRVVLNDGRWSLKLRADEQVEEGYSLESSGVWTIDELDPQMRQVLFAASIIGQQFDATTLMHLLGNKGVLEDSDLLPRALRRFVSTGILEATDEGYRFSAGAIRARSRELGTEEEARQFHLVLARWLVDSQLESVEDHWPRAAEHFCLAGDKETAVDYHLKFARWTAERGANYRSQESYQLALGLIPQSPRRSNVLEELGRLNHRMGDLDAALDCLRSAADAASSPSQLLSILSEKADVHHRRGDFDLAQGCLQQALEVAKGNDRWAARLWYRLGVVHFARQQLNRAAEFFQKSLDIYRNAKDLNGMATVLVGQGLISKRRGELDAAVAHFEDSIACSDKAGNLNQMAASLNNLALAHRVRGDHAEAIQSFRRSLELRERLGDRLGNAICLNNLSVSFQGRGEFQDAVEAAQEALLIFQELGDKRGVLSSRGNLGLFILHQGRLQEAAQLFQENLPLAKRLKDARTTLGLIQYLALVESGAGNYPAEEKRFREGLKIVADARDAGIEAHFLADFALCLLRNGNREGAIDALRDSAEKAREAQEPRIHGWLRYAESELHFQDEDFDKALESALEALKLVEKSGSKPDAAVLNRQLGRIYRELGPDWVDRTEKRFRQARRSFQEMGTPIGLGITLMEEARLWIFLEEFEEAAACLEEATELFRQCGATLRREEAEKELKNLRNEN